MVDFWHNQRTDEAALTASPALTTQPIEAVAMADESLNPSEEIWKPIEGFPDYDVSSLGRVRSWRAYRGIGRRATPRIIGDIPAFTKSGRPKTTTNYLRSPSGEAEAFATHRLVLAAFVGPCPEGMEGCHWDGNPFNNRLDNLRWDTRKANIADARRHGTHSSVTRSPLTAADVLEIRAAPSKWGVLTRLGRRFGVGASAILKIRRRQAWKHV